MAQTIACQVCGLVHEVDQPLPRRTIAKCRRCGSRMEALTRGTLHLTAAFALAALILYIPANYFSILRIELYGAASENTVWDGTKLLYKDGDYTIATIVLLASIIIPVLKLTALFSLVILTWLRSQRLQLARTLIYRVVDVVGRWAMLDVFVVAILVSLVKLQKLATILPGKGLFAFGCVVVLTTLASMSFEPQLIWQTHEESKA